jgi:outer membrane protein assembly factor BamB
MFSMCRWRFVPAFAVGVLGLAATARAENQVEGVWMGRVTAPQGDAEIGFAFKRTPRGLTAAMHMPLMHVYNLPLGPVGEAGSAFTIPPLDTVMELRGDLLTGIFALGRLPLELHRGGAFAAEPASARLPAGPAPRWARQLGAAVWASPVARDGVVYLGTADGHFHAVRAADGSDVWTWTGPNALYGQALVTDGSICLADAHSDLVCLDRVTGNLQWRAPLCNPKTGGAALADRSFTHRTPVPVLADGVIYAGSADGDLCAIESATGKTLWRHGVGAPIYAGVALPGRDALVAGCFDGTVVTLDRRTGAELRRVRVGGPVVSAPVIAGDIAVVGSRDYLLYGVSLSRAQVAWKYSYWFSWVESAPQLVDGVAYIGSSDFRRVSALNPTTGTMLWLADVRGITWGTPVVTADTVYAGTQGQSPAFLHHEGGIVALDRRTGIVKWRVALTGKPDAERVGCIGSLALADDRLIAAAYDGTLAAYPME